MTTPLGKTLESSHNKPAITIQSTAPLFTQRSGFLFNPQNLMDKKVATITIAAGISALALFITLHRPPPVYLVAPEPEQIMPPTKEYVVAKTYSEDKEGPKPEIKIEPEPVPKEEVKPKIDSPKPPPALPNSEDEAPKPEEPPKPENTPTPPVATEGEEEDRSYEESGVNVKRSLIATFPNGTSETVRLSIPVMYKSGLLRLDPENKKEMLSILKEIKQQQDALQKIQGDMEKTKTRWTKLLETCTPFQSLLPESPSLPANQIHNKPTNTNSLKTQDVTLELKP